MGDNAPGDPPPLGGVDPPPSRVHIADRSQMIGDRLSMQIVSDVHVEYYPLGDHPQLPRHAPILCLLGDIGVLAEKDDNRAKYAAFLADHAARFDRVIVLFGNHEYYGIRVHEATVVFQRIVDDAALQNVQLLQRNTALLGKFRVIGATLWSQVPEDMERAVTQRANDYYQIKIRDEEDGKVRRLAVSDTNQFFEADRAWIESQVAEARQHGQTAVVLTHHAPLPGADCLPERALGTAKETSSCTNLLDMMGPPVALWAFGHTHYAVDVVRNGTRVVSNPVGYKYELVTDFSANKVFHVDENVHAR